MCSLFERHPLLRPRGVRGVVVENTSGIKSEIMFLQNGIQYVAFGENRGLANACQFGYDVAKSAKFRFLVLL